MRLELTIGAATIHAELLDTESSRDFASLLPLTVTVSDFHATEKIADLPRPLSTDGAPDGTDAGVGDIAYYAPWGNLAIFYRSFGHAAGLVTLGRIIDDIDVIGSAPDGTAVTIAVATDGT